MVKLSSYVPQRLSPQCPSSRKKGTHALLNSAIDPAAWAPLQHREFRMLWIASIISNLGSWMHEVGAGWLKTSLAPTPLMVALVQAATTAPVFLLAGPAGALADIVDRRRHLIITQIWMMSMAALLGIITLAGAITAPLLLLFFRPRHRHGHDDAGLGRH